MFDYSLIINTSLNNFQGILKSNNPKILRKMRNCLRSLFCYFENVLHPAAGSESIKEKRKSRGTKAAVSFQASPECINIRGMAKKQDKIRRNPAP